MTQLLIAKSPLKKSWYEAVDLNKDIYNPKTDNRLLFFLKTTLVVMQSVVEYGHSGTQWPKNVYTSLNGETGD